MSFFSREVYPNADVHIYRLKTLDPSFKGVVFNYENQIHYFNQLNYKNSSTFVLCKEYFMKTGFVFYFRKNHYIIDDINTYLDGMRSNGFIDFISSKYAQMKNLKDEDTGPKMLELQHLNGAFKIYFILNLIAFAVFLLEVMFKRILK